MSDRSHASNLENSDRQTTNLFEITHPKSLQHFSADPLTQLRETRLHKKIAENKPIRAPLIYETHNIPATPQNQGGSPSKGTGAPGAMTTFESMQLKSYSQNNYDEHLVRAILNRGLAPTKQNMRNFPLFMIRFAPPKAGTSLKSKLHRQRDEKLAAKQQADIEKM